MLLNAQFWSEIVSGIMAEFEEKDSRRFSVDHYREDHRFIDFTFPSLVSLHGPWPVVDGDDAKTVLKEGETLYLGGLSGFPGHPIQGVQIEG